MDNASPFQRRKILATRALAVVCFLLVILWFMVPDAEDWNRGPKIPGFYSDHATENDSNAEIKTASAAPAKETDFSKFESPPFNPNAQECLNPKNKPPLEYAIMIDAGSTGSRVHVYEFSNCDGVPDMKDETFVQIKPGLSSYGNDPEKAAASLDELMDVAMKKVPKALRKCTPVAVKATAGLRLLGPEKSQHILDAVRSRLETSYPFPLAGADAVAVMDGRDEGVYAWITVNYLLGNLGTSVDRPGTAAVFDLGGASTQIVFEPSFASKKEKLAPGEHEYLLTFNERDYHLYQHSYLGYGLMEARKKMMKHVADRAHRSNDSEEEEDTIASIAHPCFPSDHSEMFPVNDTLIVKLHGSPGAPLHAQCLTLAEKILEKDAACPTTPCSFAGTYQPSLTRTFSREEIYAFSYFYDRTAPLGMPSEFSLKDLRELADRVCMPNPEKNFEHLDEEDIKELMGEPLWCMDLAFIYGLLNFGYEIPNDRIVKVAKKVKGAETGWCLGAAMTMLDGVGFCELD